MLTTLHFSSGIKAALLAVGATTSAVAPAPHTPVPAPHTHTHTHTQAAPATQRAILLQIDHRLGVIERTQQAMLRGYETGGIYR
jgi:hypothetical protein